MTTYHFFGMLISMVHYDNVNLETACFWEEFLRVHERKLQDTVEYSNRWHGWDR